MAGFTIETSIDIDREAFARVAEALVVMTPSERDIATADLMQRLCKASGGAEATAALKAYLDAAEQAP